MTRTIFPILMLCLSAGMANAQDNWRLVEVDASAFPNEIVKDQRRRSPGGLPDGRVATFRGLGDITEAWYSDPTDRYGHAILGDGIEAGTLNVVTGDGERLSLELSQDQVFEDLYPRLADLDNDGTIEVVTLRSSAYEGGSIAVFGLQNGKLVQKAATPFIGRSYRWLNIAGIASFRGKASKEIAFVETPHIGGTLYFYSYNGQKLTKRAQLYGFSNHFIGSTEMRLSATTDVNGDGILDLALPSANRRALRIVSLASGRLRELATIPMPSRISKAIAVSGSGLSTSFVVGLDNGKVLKISR
ncbi:hypothetical protein N9K16_04725 [Alphaproteobacteria bacterium]|jgi:hypothetical protein|nr:hypothetical protein [Alphaproteobacteria bacterium]